MPPLRELPRREIEHKPEAKTLFEEREAEIKPRGFKNSTRWSGTIGKPLPDGHPNLSKYSAQFQGTVEALKKSADFGGIGGQRAAALWKPRIEKARVDLGGFWNDVKLELGSRAGTSANPDTAKRTNTALDLLEVAEQRGGLGTRLEQWNELVSSQMYSYDLLAETAGEIKQGIEFCKEMVKEAFDRELGLGKEAEKNRSDLISALDAIASEIAREADKILGGEGSQGSRVDPGKPFDAVRERFKDVSPRTGITERLHDAFEGGTVAQNWVGELPESMQKDSATQRLSQSLEDWQAAAQKVRDVLSEEHEDGDEEKAAKALDAAAGDTVKWIKSQSTTGASPDQISMALHVYQRIGEEILAQHRDLSKQVLSIQARQTLRDAVNYQELLYTVTKLRTGSPGDSVYFKAHYSFGQGKLDEFWRQGKDSVDKGLRSANPKLADEFKTVGQNLENLLARWTKRDSQTSYKLAWEVTANLRDLKQRSEGLPPAQRDYVRSALDAIADCIAEDIQTLNL